VTGKEGIRCKQLLDDLKETRGYWKLKEEALDRTVWRTRFGRGYGAVVRQTAEWMNTYKVNTFSKLYVCFRDEMVTCVSMGEGTPSNYCSERPLEFLI
jgi:hypothetical protein